jgi:hypothetical protein
MSALRTFIDTLRGKPKPYLGPDRRHVDRLFAPPCPRCHARDGLHGTSRTQHSVNFECKECGEVVCLRKPRA